MGLSVPRRNVSTGTLPGLHGPRVRLDTDPRGPELLGDVGVGAAASWITTTVDGGVGTRATRAQGLGPRAR